VTSVTAADVPVALREKLLTTEAVDEGKPENYGLKAQAQTAIRFAQFS